MQEKLRVLVVDDHVDAADLICDLMGRVHECRTAHSGAEALEVASGFHPHVVLLDIGLPDMSGYEVARALRDAHGVKLFLAAVSGWGQEADRLRAFDAGFDHHTLKPASRAALYQIIDAALARHEPPAT